MSTTTLAPVVETPERVTPIRPSEALRLGRLTRPRRIRGDYFEGADGACALGAIHVGYGGGFGIGIHVEFGGMPGYVAMRVLDMNDDEWATDAEIGAYLEGLGL